MLHTGLHADYNRTATVQLNTEYVGTMDFKLEDADYEFLWRKGYLSCKYWLAKRTEKAMEKKKKVASALAKEMKSAAMAWMYESKPNGKESQPTPAVSWDLALSPTPPSDGTPMGEFQKRLHSVLANKHMDPKEKLLIIEKLTERMAKRSR